MPPYRIAILIIAMLLACGCRKASSSKLEAYHLSSLIGAASKSVVDMESVRIEPCSVKVMAGGDSLSPTKSKTEMFLASASSSCVRGTQLLICDRLNDCIFVADSEGTILRKIGRHGKGPGEFIGPVHIACNTNFCFVYDLGNGRIQILDREFDYVSSIPAVYNFLSGCLAASRDQVYIHGSYADTLLLKRYSSISPFDLVSVSIPLLVPRTERSQAYNSVKFSANEDGWLCIGYTGLPYLFVFDPQGIQRSTIELQGKGVEQLKEHPNGLKASGAMMKIFIAGISVFQDGSVVFSDGHRIFVLENSNGTYRLKRVLRPGIGENVIRHICLDERRGRVFLTTDVSVSELDLK